MTLRELWKQYGDEADFNVTCLPEELKSSGKIVTFAPKQMIMIQGDQLKYIYFFLSGRAIGKRIHQDGKELNYFTVDEKSGNIGLLELIARTDQIVATITTLTEVKALRIEAARVFEYIMSDISLLRRCASLVARDLYITSNSNGRFYYVTGIDRVRYYFAELYEKTGKEILELHTEYQAIANTTGTSVRTVGRSIQKMKQNGELKPLFRKLYIGKTEYRKLLDALFENN